MGGLHMMKSMFAVPQGSNHFSALSLKRSCMMENQSANNEKAPVDYKITDILVCIQSCYSLYVYAVVTSKDMLYMCKSLCGKFVMFLQKCDFIFTQNTQEYRIVMRQCVKESTENDLS